MTTLCLCCGKSPEEHTAFQLVANREAAYKPRSTPTVEWLERQLHSYYASAEYRTFTPQEHIHSLAEHIRGRWLQVESLEVEMLRRAANLAKLALKQRKQANNAADRQGKPVILLSAEPYALGLLEEALALFDKP